jgi:RimJ/RimL family protein N-acetyltransferase
MTEAVETLVEWSFSHPDCEQVTATSVLPDNYASRKVLIKAGFKETGMGAAGVNYLRVRG